MRRFIPKSEYPKILDLYLKGESCNKLKDDIGISFYLLRKIIIESGYSMRKKGEARREYPLNVNMFKTLDTEKPNYLLGWIFSDGTVGKNSVTVTVKHTDKAILEQLSEYIYPEYRPLTFYKRSGGNRQDQYRLQISSIEIVKDLANLGCIPNKSLVLEYPFGKIPDEHLHHFVRSYFDGNGSICTDKQGKTSVSFHGATPFITGLSEILNEKLNLNTTPRPHGKISYIRVQSKHKILDLMNWMYQDATLFLKRKKDKFDLFVKNNSHLLNDNNYTWSPPTTIQSTDKYSPNGWVRDIIPT